MRPWRDIISHNAWQQVVRKNDSTAKISRMQRFGADLFSSVETPQRVLKQMGNKIQLYHMIDKTDYTLLESRINALYGIAKLADHYLKAFKVNMQHAAKRVEKKHLFTNSYTGGTPQQESLDRNVLTLVRRSLRKIGYLRELKKFYDGSSSGPHSFRPSELLDYLRAPPQTGGELATIVPGVRMEVLDPLHRPVEVRFDENGRIKPNGLEDDYSISVAFRIWMETLDKHKTPFFMWLENHDICTLDDKAYIAGTRTVAYADADKRQCVAGNDKFRMVSFDGHMKMVRLETINEPAQVASTAGYYAADRKGGPDTAAFIWSQSYELFIGEHQESAFHHSTFVSGRDVRCAGMIKIDNGKVTYLSNNSGHYRPSKTHLKNFLDFLHDKNAIDAKAAVECLGINDFQGTVRDFYFKYPTL